MGDIPASSEEAPSKGPSLYDAGGLSPGGQVYTNTEIGKYIYGGEIRGIKGSVAAAFLCDNLGFFSLHVGLHYLSEYGWYVVLVVVCLGLVWMKLGPVVSEWWTRRKAREEELNFGK